SIDTYLKFSEAVGQVVPASRPALDGRSQDALVEENAALRAQIAAGTDGRRRRRSARVSGGSRAPAVRRPAGPVGRNDARLALTEFLLRCEVVHECALWALEWLGELVGVRRAACFLVDHEASELGAVAVYGAAPSTISRMTISLDQRDHPLIGALRTIRPIELSPATFGPRLRRPPLSGSAPFLALPLGHLGDEGSEAPGLILLSPAPPNAVREATWLAGILGRHLTRLRAVEQRAAAHRRLEG